MVAMAFQVHGLNSVEKACKATISLGLMNDISIGAVGAAIIAGLVSVLGLVIGKEQKVSEFRQAWIDELRKCLVAYLVNINAISDAIRTKQPAVTLAPFYKALNEANHGIKLRLNDKEPPSIRLLESMQEFENLAKTNNQLTPSKILIIENKFLLSSKNLLKFEWQRVKRGEPTYFISKRIVIGLIVVMLLLLGYLWYSRAPLPQAGNNEGGATQTISTHVVCEWGSAARLPDGRGNARARVDRGHDGPTSKQWKRETAICASGEHLTIDVDPLKAKGTQSAAAQPVE